MGFIGGSKSAKIIAFLILAAFLVQGVSAQQTSFDRLQIKSISGIYPKIQFNEMDFYMTGGHDAIIITKDEIAEYSEMSGSCSYFVNTEEINKAALLEIEAGNLFYPNGPVIAFGHDFKETIWVEIEYREKDCKDEIMKIYDIISKSASDFGYDGFAVVFQKAHIAYL